MRTNLIFFLFIIIISCSPKVNLELDIENLKKDGISILQSKNLKFDRSEVYKISQLATYPVIKNKNWTNPNFNSSTPIPNIELDINFSISKTNNFFKDVKNNFYRKEILSIDKNTIFVDDQSTLFVINEDFKLLNRFKIHNLDKNKGYPLKFSLAWKNNILFISDNLGSILAYDLNFFKIIWRNDLEVPFLSNLALSEKSIFVSNSNGKVYSFDILTGKQNWSFETGTQTAKSHKAYRMSVVNNKLLFSNDFGKITCIDLAKEVLLWSHTLQLATAYHDINLLELADFVVENNNLYITSSFGSFLKLDLNSGKILWSNDIFSTKTTPLINKNTAALVSNDGFLNVLDKTTGKLLYKKNLLKLLRIENIETKNIIPNNIFLLSDKLYITTNNGYFFWADSKNLEAVKYKKISNTISSNISISKQNIFFVGNDDTIFKIQ